jgi:hypothetical protein
MGVLEKNEDGNCGGIFLNEEGKMEIGPVLEKGANWGRQ